VKSVFSPFSFYVVGYKYLIIMSLFSVSIVIIPDCFTTCGS